MAVFTTESAVRQKFQVNDTVWAPPALVIESINEAHELIMQRLDHGMSVSPLPPVLVLGETLLAGAYLLRSLASKEASLQKEVMIAGQRITTGGRFAALMTLSDQTEELAWKALEVFLGPCDGTTAAVVTDTVPVLG